MSFPSSADRVRICSSSLFLLHLQAIRFSPTRRYRPFPSSLLDLHSYREFDRRGKSSIRGRRVLGLVNNSVETSGAGIRLRNSKDHSCFERFLTLEDVFESEIFIVACLQKNDPNRFISYHFLFNL